ncbi:WXG100 family type VII secretion target [Micromonospora echinospora]|uniref:WXG100 family type VII secretion target n=1 Tax=Micromonospora echinospora TaxID=1877 RepID=UPI00379323CE
MAETQAGYVVPGIKLDSIVADEATITGMVKAFAQAQIEARDSHSNVVAATEMLTRSWSSDTAAPRFLQAVQQWLAGFQKVQQGLDMLNLNMQQYARLTTTTEDDSAMQAGNWAREQPLPGLSRVLYTK